MVRPGGGCEFNGLGQGRDGNPGWGAGSAGHAEFRLADSRGRATDVKDPLAGMEPTIFWLSDLL